MATKMKAPSKTNSSSKKLGNPQMITAILSYIGVLVFVPLLFYDKRDDFMRFHLRQGLALFAVELVLMLVSWIFWAMVPITHVLLIIVYIASLVSLVKAVMGQQWKVPLLEPVVQRIPALK